MPSYLTTKDLAARLHYTPSTIRNQLKDTVLIEGVHYIQPFGRRKILYIWEAIERDMQIASQGSRVAMPSTDLVEVVSG